MTAPAIEFRGVSHAFRISTEGKISSMKEWLIRRMTGRVGTFDEFVALDDVSFDVEPGTALGVVGRNGAGKSTLLRVAAGILQPTRGMAVVRGKIAPIIELGIGFEQELTGRENIIFNGALLGRSRTEMNERMPEIVDFADLHEFIDQPIRTFSTGMVARLAFAVATTVEANVLLLDEVLAVGDEKFKQKCNRRIDSFRKRGVTILFVSHDLSATEALCDEAVWLDGGSIRSAGEPAQIVRDYTVWAGGSA